MIFETLHIIREELNQFLDPAGTVEPVVVENISILDNADNTDRETDLVNRIACTLINIEEESALKNFPNHTIEAGTIKYKNPKVYLNLYVLFSANLTTYQNSLEALANIIRFFQAKKTFSEKDTTSYLSNTEVTLDLSSFRFNVELHTPSFEVLNHIWGTLGGRQLPCVLYKFSILELERNVLKGGGGLIQEIQGELEDMNLS